MREELKVLNILNSKINETEKTLANSFTTHNIFLLLEVLGLSWVVSKIDFADAFKTLFCIAIAGLFLGLIGLTILSGTDRIREEMQNLWNCIHVGLWHIQEAQVESEHIPNLEEESKDVEEE